MVWWVFPFERTEREIRRRCRELFSLLFSPLSLSFHFNVHSREIYRSTWPSDVFLGEQIIEQFRDSTVRRWKKRKEKNFRSWKNSSKQLWVETLDNFSGAREKHLAEVKISKWSDRNDMYMYRERGGGREIIETRLSRLRKIRIFPLNCDNLAKRTCLSSAFCLVISAFLPTFYSSRSIDRFVHD